LNWTKQLLIDLSKLEGQAGLSTIEPILGLRNLGVLPPRQNYPGWERPLMI